MTKKKILTLYALTLPVLLLFFTNMGAPPVEKMLEPKEEKLQPEKIADGINKIIDKIEAGIFGEKGTNIMNVHVTKMTNVLAKKIEAERCSDLREYIPRLPTGFYHLWSNPDGDTQFCESYVDLIHKTFLEISGKKANSNELSQWLGVIGLKGHLETIARIAEDHQKTSARMTPQSLVQALFKVLTHQDPSAQELAQWTEHLRNVGLRRLVSDLGTTPLALKTHASFFHGIKGGVSKIKVRSGKLRFKGWACFSRSTEPLKVEIYSADRRTRSNKQLIGTVTTKIASSNGVNRECGTEKQKHNFELRVGQREFRQRSRVALFYAVNEFNGGKVLLNPNKTINIHEYRRDDDDD